MAEATHSRLTILFWIVFFGCAVTALGVHDLEKRGFRFGKSQPLSQEEARELVKALHGSIDYSQYLEKHAGEREEASRQRQEGRRGFFGFLKSLIP